ncbi:MAG TPA: hypothetical protein VEA59_05555 [Patescibacteria group bacterium]|nr:hypothetical protein [Patescibacteria group bacterium]
MKDHVLNAAQSGVSFLLLAKACDDHGNIYLGSGRPGSNILLPFPPMLWSELATELAAGFSREGDRILYHNPTGHFTVVGAVVTGWEHIDMVDPFVQSYETLEQLELGVLEFWREVIERAGQNPDRDTRYKLPEANLEDVQRMIWNPGSHVLVNGQILITQGDGSVMFLRI